MTVRVDNWQTSGFALYVHWPFCQSKCPYCDFNSHVASTINQDEWKRAYISELRRTAAETPGRRLTSIYFGGGTPSLMPAATVSAIIDEATRLWTPSNDIEITLEANPTSVEIGAFNDFRLAGINRVSVGIQALNNRDLRRLGRMHDADEARAAIAIAQEVFNRSSFDLIYARQDQSLAEWEKELGFALSIAKDHLSLYQLTVEPGTVFAQRLQKGQLRGLPEEDLAADMYDLTQDLCKAFGRPAYEVSNHALPGSESRHNLVYWRCGDYLGIGPGAHGRITLEGGQRYATAAARAPSAWLSLVASAGNGEEEREALSRHEQGLEYVMMGLRLTEGISLQRYKDISGIALAQDRVDHLCTLDLLASDQDRIATTAAGRLVLNSLIKHLFT